MKNRSSLVISAFCLMLAMLFTACAQLESANDAASSDESVVESTLVSADESDTEAINTSLDEISLHEEESGANECVHGEDSAFVIASNGGSYSIVPETKTGSFLAEFTAVSSENLLEITLSDGRTMEFSYGEVWYDESDDIYRTKINELDFMITESLDSSNNRVQVFECIEPVDFSDHLISTIIVTYYPETEKGSLQIWFAFEADGEEYTFYYTDGYSTVKTILYDEENETHYFAESEAEQE